MSSSSNATIVTRETSDSNSRSEPSHVNLSKKRRRSKHEAHPGYKGVVLQQNRNWGAQIYFNNERIWLGTFKSEKEAGMAYDSAALKLRDGNFDRNFPWTNLTIHEPQFQRRFTNEAVLNMIKDGSYTSRLANYINALGKTEQEFVVAHGNLQQPHSVDTSGGYFSKRLFQKELTPSDVGKLNRLVIPKKAAVKFFPPVPVGEEGQGAEEVELTFHDRSMRIWKFRYCYWKSSQSFVFTRGWNRFVSVNNLRSRDMLTFSLCEPQDNISNEASVIHVIEVSHRNREENGNIVASAVDGNVVESLNDVDEEEVEGGVADDLIESIRFSGVEGNNGNLLKREEMGRDEDGSVEEKKNGFRLFGVQIL